MRMRAPLTATSQRPPPCLALAGRVARPWLGLALRCGPLQAPVRSQRTRTRTFHPHPHHTTSTPTTRTRSSRAGTFVSRPACARAARRPPPTVGRHACGGRRGAFPKRAAGPTNALARNRARGRARARAGERARVPSLTPTHACPAGASAHPARTSGSSRRHMHAWRACSELRAANGSAMGLDPSRRTERRFLLMAGPGSVGEPQYGTVGRGTRPAFTV